MDVFDRVAHLIEELGEFACREQGTISRSYKDDGSVLTATDTAINEQVTEALLQLFPTANIVAEEAPNPFNDNAPLTFILDPIDGTDVYSQGLPSWCISLGILDKNRQVVGAMVNAPRWGLSRDEGLFLRQDPGKQLLLNGEPFTSRLADEEVTQIAMASYTPSYVSMNNFKGKIRAYGSNILHMISPLIHPYIQGSISVPCFAWDVAGAHALLASQGMVVAYADGQPFEYTDAMLDQRQPFTAMVYSGTATAVKTMATLFI